VDIAIFCYRPTPGPSPGQPVGWEPYTAGKTGQDGRWATTGDRIGQFRFMFSKPLYFAEVQEGYYDFGQVDIEQGMTSLPYEDGNGDDLPPEEEEGMFPRPSDYLPNWTWKDWAIIFGSIAAWMGFEWMKRKR